MKEVFRTTEISDPKFESDHLRFITVKTNNLKGRGDICIFVPPVKNAKDLPLVVLLHGVYGSSWSWAKQGGVHRTAWQMIQNEKIKPMVIAMPSDGLWGDGSGYLPHSGKDFEKWIVDDVPNVIMQNIPSVSSKSDIFIAGLSMGGFGALRLGAKYANKFKAISAHSPITEIEQMESFVEEPLDSYFQVSTEENSVIGVISEHKSNLPKIRFDCGTEDSLLEPNRKLHRDLQEAGIKHTYEEFAGGHEWPYWQEHIADTLRFFHNES